MIQRIVKIYEILKVKKNTIMYFLDRKHKHCIQIAYRPVNILLLNIDNRTNTSTYIILSPADKWHILTERSIDG